MVTQRNVGAVADELRFDVHQTPTPDPLYTSWNARDSAAEVRTNLRESMVQYEVVDGNHTKRS